MKLTNSATSHWYNLLGKILWWCSCKIIHYENVILIASNRWQLAAINRSSNANDKDWHIHLIQLFSNCQRWRARRSNMSVVCNNENCSSRVFSWFAILPCTRMNTESMNMKRLSTTWKSESIMVKPYGLYFTGTDVDASITANPTMKPNC